ncbi:MAG: helix-turn-helix transcriptional regulator [Anaerolineae bacterium]
MPDVTDVKKALLRRKILGVRIRHARSSAGLNLREVGQALGIPAGIVSELELGQRDPSLPQLEVLALLFNVPISYFWADDPIESEKRPFPTVEAIALRQRIIGVLLRQARTEAGRSKEDVASLLEVPVSQVEAYELGSVEIPLSSLEFLAPYLKVSMDYFIDQGIPSPQNGDHVGLDQLARFSELPKETREFLANPANALYINIAMRLSDLSAETLRSLAEGLLEVTY